MPASQLHYGAAGRDGDRVPFTTVCMLRVANHASAHGIATIEFDLSQVGPTFSLGEIGPTWNNPQEFEVHLLRNEAA
jgi:hypothetical protein